MTDERRALLKQLEADKENRQFKEDYNLALIKRVAMQTISERSYDAAMYQDLKVDEKIYLKSLQMYMMDPEKRKLIEESTEALREKYRKSHPKEMDKEKVLECTKLLEQFKFEAQVKMYTIVRMQQMPPEMINSVIMFEKEQADDSFWLKTGFEEEDVDHNLKRLSLEKDDDYLKISEEWKEKSEKFLNERQAEAAEQQRVMKERQEAYLKSQQEASHVEETTPA
jgi:hypothetical protein